MQTPSADQISQEVSKERQLLIQPWVAAHLSDVWQSMKTNLSQTIARKDKQDRVRISQVMPASSHNPT
jgi:hypothetical protein